MSEQQNLRLVQEFMQLFKRGDVTGALNTLADDVGWFLPGPKDIIPFVGSAPRPTSLGEIRIATS